MEVFKNGTPGLMGILHMKRSNWIDNESSGWDKVTLAVTNSCAWWTVVSPGYSSSVTQEIYDGTERQGHIRPHVMW